MPFKKGQSGNPNGRPKGILSPMTQIKEDWLKVYAEKGNGLSLLRKLAKDNPQWFFDTGVKMLPKEVAANLSGDLQVGFRWEDDEDNNDTV